MSYTLEFKLAGLPKMSNQLLRGHWRAKHGHAVKWKAYAIGEIERNGKPARPLQKATLSLTRHSSHEPDFDGLVSSFKHIIDALVTSEVIENDKQSIIGQPTYLWKKAPPGKGFITVKVEGL